MRALLQGLLDGLEKLGRDADVDSDVESLTGPYGYAIRFIHRVGKRSGSEKTLHAIERVMHNVPHGPSRSGHE